MCRRRGRCKRLAREIEWNGGLWQTRLALQTTSFGVSHARPRRPADWNVTLDGVHGTVQLYANSPDRASAVAGALGTSGWALQGSALHSCGTAHCHHVPALTCPPAAGNPTGSAAFPWELSIRVARKDAGERLHSILELIASAADVLGVVGWDAAPSGAWAHQW